MLETWVQSLGQEDPLEKEMATYFSILAWRIPWTEKPVGCILWDHKESDRTERLSTHTYKKQTIYFIAHLKVSLPLLQLLENVCKEVQQQCC